MTGIFSREVREGRTAQRRPWARAVWCAMVTFLLAASVAACGGSRGTGPPAPAASPSSGTSAGTPRPAPTSAATTPGTTPDGPSATGSPGRLRPTSAAAGLASFFTEVERSDLRIRTAAGLINGDVGATGAIEFRPETLAAMRAAWPPAAVARAVPAGLPPALLRSVLLVYSDLAARAAAVAMTGHETGRVDQLSCLARGAAPAVRFRDDVAALRAQADAAPAFAAVPPDSRAAAEIQLRTAYIDGFNAGCGGHVFTELTPIVWQTRTLPGGEPPVDGTIGAASFRAGYKPGSGWHVTILAC